MEVMNCNRSCDYCGKKGEIVFYSSVHGHYINTNGWISPWMTDGDKPELIEKHFCSHTCFALRQGQWEHQKEDHDKVHKK